MSLISRRRALSGLAGAAPALLLGGCGFRPVYGRAAGGVTGSAQSGLAAIEIANIPDRNGQVLREALEARFEREGPGVAHHYDLLVAYNIGEEGIAIEPDSSVTRNRYIGRASWSLVAKDPPRATLTSGSARSIDGVDVVNEQFFAADLNGDNAQWRISHAIADQITLQLAAYFNNRARQS